MQYLTMPNTRLQSSVISLGTDGFGTSKSKEEAFALMDCYLEGGGNHLDTACIYPAGNFHLSESVIGAYLKEKKCRHDVLLTTKGGHPPIGEMHRSRLGRAEIQADIDGSLSALGTDYVDVYLLHRDAPAMEVGEIMESLSELVRTGKTRYIGVSNWRGDRIAQANAYAKAHNLPPLVASQIKFSLAMERKDIDGDVTLVEMDEREHGFYTGANLTVMEFSSQAKGFFSKLAMGEPLSQKAASRYDSKKNRERFFRAEKLARELGVSAGAVALGYLICQPFASIPVVGCSRLEQLHDSMMGAEVTLNQEQMYFLRG